MAQSGLPENVFYAAIIGDTLTIKEWLETRISWPDLSNRYGETATILEGTRLAGHSYKRWVLKDYMALLRLRSMLARGRARHRPETPEAVARLFDGVPDPCFWKVVEYAWLGDWRRP